MTVHTVILSGYRTCSARASDIEKKSVFGKRLLRRILHVLWELRVKFVAIIERILDSTLHIKTHYVKALLPAIHIVCSTRSPCWSPCYVAAAD